ncbi:hypothetical protein Tco_0165912, partial [Tanacetum coccineum]
IYLRINTGSLKLIKQIVDPRKWIRPGLILNDPSFFLANKTGAPQAEELGLMNPLSESSCNCSDNSFISDGANWYGARATGAAPKIKSIWNSTGRAGGRPGKSSRNTSGKSRMIVSTVSIEVKSGRAS